jgi:hypothetical protein
MEARPGVGILAIDTDSPWRYLEIRGRVVEIMREGAVEHVNSLGQAYTGKPLYGDAAAEAVGYDMKRGAIFKIRPEKVLTLETLMEQELKPANQLAVSHN